VLLDQQKGDTGSASSLINTLFTVFGSFGMSLASMPWGNIVIGLGAVITVFSLLAQISWRLFIKSGIPCNGIKSQVEL
jgi:DHA1 family bicyclomycin/chloramphenicol resistance-like MFS transporter